MKGRDDDMITHSPLKATNNRAYILTEGTEYAYENRIGETRELISLRRGLR